MPSIADRVERQVPGKAREDCPDCFPWSQECGATMRSAITVSSTQNSTVSRKLRTMTTRRLVRRDEPKAPSEHHRLAFLTKMPPAQCLDTDRRKTGERAQKTHGRKIAKERQVSNRAHQRAEACQHQ